jgi:hypothetical protein
VRVRALVAGLVGIAALGADPAGGQIARRVDRVQYSIHVDVANQMDLEELRLYLAEADALLQGDQGSNDIACCMSLQADSLVVFGTPGDGLDVIDDEEEWNAIQGRRSIVQTVNWCGSHNPSLIGCGVTPGNTLVVGLDAGPQTLSRVLAHERGHNANLSHRDEPCALMAPSINSQSGCLNTSECTWFRWLSGSTLQGACDCMGPNVGDPVDPDGSACTANGAPGFCHDSGLCDAVPPNDVCAQATPLSGTLVRADTNYSAGTDGGASCAAGSGDVWYRYTPACTGRLEVDLCDAAPDLMVSAHASCSGASSGEWVCAAGCAVPPPGCRSGGACLASPVQSGTPVWLRVASQTAARGPFVLRARCQPEALADLDLDGVADVLDNCPYFANPQQTDTNANGIGNLCECGDQNGDGRVDSADLVAINLAIFAPSLATPLCDANGDNRCDVRDIFATNAKIFGGRAHCDRYP